MEEAPINETFELIHNILASDKNKLNISWLCEEARVSRSGYYNWLSRKNKRDELEKQDEADFELIKMAYNYRGYAKGSRSIHMRLLHMGVRMNRKKIQRLMKKYNLFCPIRKANPYRRMAKALKTDTIAENVVKREFTKYGPGKVLLTDITYLKLRKGEFVYLSTVKDAFTKQILAYRVSDSLDVDFVIDTMSDLKINHGDKLKPGAIIHSDQGAHYTSIAFRELFKKDEDRPEENHWIQSMSRRGNCWDNAPQESFFGHMKDEINLKDCKIFDDVKAIIEDYMDYYNNERYQLGLEKLSPNQYSTYLKTGIHPLDKVA